MMDNTFLDADYEAQFDGMPEWQQKQLIEGDWNVVPGAFFDCWNSQNIVKPFRVPDRAGVSDPRARLSGRPRRPAELRRSPDSRLHHFGSTSPGRGRRDIRWREYRRRLHPEAHPRLRPRYRRFLGYVWSLPCFLEVARRLRKEIPDCTILFGGPSARPEMFAIDPYKSGVDVIDALVIQHGEETIRDIVLSSDRSPDDFSRIAGLAVARNGAWDMTPPRPSANLEILASPAQMGLIPRGAWHYLETYRGCPMSCSFCNGVARKLPRTSCRWAHRRELAAFRPMTPSASFTSMRA
jgi:hypothetical protein